MIQYLSRNHGVASAEELNFIDLFKYRNIDMSFFL